MVFARHRLVLSVLAVLVWVLVTIAPSFLPHEMVSLADAASGGIVFNTLLAAVVLLVIALALGWNDLGFSRPRPWKSLWLLWMPGLYLAVFYAIDIVGGFPPLPTLAILFVNTLLVGISEELAFRGVLFRGLRSRLGMWPSIIIASLVFGAVHVLNVFTTGNLLASAAQAIAAAMTGVAFIAIVIRTGSIIPAIVVHVLWDFGSLVAVTSAVAGADAAAAGGATIPEISPWLYLVPLAFNLPNFLYALYLLRRRRINVHPAPVAVPEMPAVQT